jgi:glycosyltransferase involved in cell wall biosynthesis
VQALKDGEGGLRVALAVPIYGKAHDACLLALDAAIPTLQAAGHTVTFIDERDNPYISAARATMLRKALDWKADVVVFIDHDVSFQPEALLKLIETPGDVVAGTYRFKKDDEEYMGAPYRDADGHIQGRKDGAIIGHRAPAGFLKVTKEAVDRFMRAYPDLVYGPAYNPSVDLFNHGAHEGVWYGEDYAFSRRWIDCGGELWLLPDLDLTHHAADAAFPGNFHRFLRHLPGGDLAPARAQTLEPA